MAVVPWTKVGGTEIVATGFSKTFVKEVFINPKTGKPDDYYFFAPKNRRAPTIIFPVTVDGKVIAIRQFRHGAEEVLIETPGGNPKTPEDTPEQVARIELEEETGYRAGEIIVLGKGTVWFEPCSYKIGFHPILAMDCEKVSDQALDESELLEWELIPMDEWIKMIHSGEICDSKTITVTFLALPHLQANIIVP